MSNIDLIIPLIILVIYTIFIVATLLDFSEVDKCLHQKAEILCRQKDFEFKRSYSDGFECIDMDRQTLEYNWFQSEIEECRV